MRLEHREAFIGNMKTSVEQWQAIQIIHDRVDA